MIDQTGSRLPDDALVVRGGQNLPQSFIAGRGVVIDGDGKIHNVSVNCAMSRTAGELTAPDLQTGYVGIPNKQIGVTTVGAIRAAGGEVVPTPSARNGYHATLSGLTPEQASNLFRPTVLNPNRRT